VARWFLPVCGELRVGGTFQTEGNAGGEILRCEPPRLLQITWGGPTSVVEIGLDGADEAATTFEFVHTVPLSLAQSGAGALFVGPGWDSAVTALGRYLAGEDPVDPAATGSPEFNRGSVDAWVAAIERSGTATADEIDGMAGVAMAQWAPES
jgi:hypothetical protein